MNLSARPLSIDEIEVVASQFKEDLTRECERSVRRGNNSDALAALQGKEYIDSFVYRLKLRSGSQMGQPLRARPIRVFQPPRKSKRGSE